MLNIFLCGFIFWFLVCGMLYLGIRIGLVFCTFSLFFSIFMTLMATFGFKVSYKAFKDSLQRTTMDTSTRLKNEIVLNAAAIYTLIVSVFLALTYIMPISHDVMRFLKNPSGGFLGEIISLVISCGLIWSVVQILIVRNKIAQLENMNPNNEQNN